MEKLLTKKDLPRMLKKNFKRIGGKIMLYLFPEDFEGYVGNEARNYKINLENLIGYCGSNLGAETYTGYSKKINIKFITDNATIKWEFDTKENRDKALEKIKRIIKKQTPHMC